jgi:hypothetical protein
MDWSKRSAVCCLDDRTEGVRLRWMQPSFPPGPKKGLSERIIIAIFDQVGRERVHVHLFGGGGLRMAATGMERAPFLPTERTAKKWLSVETAFRTCSPGEG